MKSILTLIIVISSIFAFGQTEKDYKKVISVSELEEMLKTNKDITLRDTYIKLDNKQEYDAQFKYGRKVIGKDAKYSQPVLDSKTGECKGWMRLGIENIKNISAYFINCKFDEVFFNDCEFRNLGYFNCEIDRIEFTNCANEDENYFIFTEPIIKQEIRISNCTFSNIQLSGINLRNNTYSNSVYCSITDNILYSPSFSGNLNLLQIEDNKIGGTANFSEINTNKLYLTNNFFLVDFELFKVEVNYEKIVNSNPEFMPSIFSITNSTIEQSIIGNNTIKVNKNFNLSNKYYKYNFTGSVFKEFTLQYDSIDFINLNETTFSKSLTIDNVILNKKFSAKGIELPQYNINFTWEFLKNKLNLSLSDSTNYSVFETQDLSDIELYNEYISTLIKFFALYKTRGDLESANSCYIEMKNAETRRLHYLYKTEGGSKNYLNYNLNRFLKFFAEYGTSPVRSVQISGWVILIFGFFYFFFYSEWDKINRKFLITKSEQLIGYFRSEQKLEDLYSDKHKDDLSTFTNFKQNLKDSKTEVPFFFMLFLKPLYWLAVLKHNFNSFLYKRIEFLQGRWVDLSKKRKFLLGTVTFLAIFSYGVYLIAIRSLNSLILSINTFTTLGFGDIPVVGISRYVAILEGFLGWFLLSIFSVSLISQILQN